MGQDSIDASLGLEFSLALFEHYRMSGLLKSELHHIPGVRGRCMGYLHLVDGKVTSCHVEDQQGQRLPIPLSILMSVEKKRGPFPWVLYPLSTPRLGTPPRPVQDTSPIPQRVGQLDVDRLEGWTTRQKMMLSIVFELVDGQRSVMQIKEDAPLSPDIVDDALTILVNMRVITVPSP
ncbi:hypothetical protein EI42_02925 [Thermosporothrix hazakensis]|uniref:Uncharacterized protein n=2 Tax=Thermosporothrix TaxID=768650 RepID=A0A326UEV0_THEHA|nr:hypothetical protein [Thermosporothrix hazakensis]PZW29203.1 hypothetical protein EI42_02925 [Thermosporothrix hazakensis]BBH86130.1 hypothetical protein KTC_08810 [Thermosporothrix sp. COM3]GCE45445.1 hypothetical protein KTH_03140 [Thermosporothrix hazakensis]